MQDDAILEIANKQKRILITSDKDFGELIFRLKLVSSGIILLRLPDLNNQKKAELVLESINKYAEVLSSSFCVITSGKIKIVAI